MPCKSLAVGSIASTFVLTMSAHAGPPPPTGACCQPEGVCLEVSAPACNSTGGEYMGDAMSCADADCYYKPATAINYQGKLAQAGVPVDDICEATFSVWDAESGGTQLGTAITLNDVNVVNGVFSVSLDFGMIPFAGRQRWLEISIGCPVGEAQTLLAPRQPLLPAPYALMSSAANRSFWIFDELGAARVMLEAGFDPEEGEYDGGLVLSSSTGTDMELGGTGLFILDSAADEDIMGLWTDNGQVGMFMAHPNGVHGANISPGNISVNAATGNGTALLYIGPDNKGAVHADSLHSNGHVYISGDLFVQGAKNFRIPNPNDPTTDLVYACPEGPEAAVYVRGTATLENGRATIAFPEHFRSIIDAGSITVHLTPHSVDAVGLAAIERSGSGFVAADREGGTYAFDYRVMAVRKGHEDFQVVRPALQRSEVAE